jgi:MFS family permease
VMALLWSLATAGCGLAASYGQMFIARLCIGVGEAAYGSVGVAVLFAIFPPSMRGTVTGAFMAGGVFGSVIGLGLGGMVTAHLGWRAAFLAMAAIGVGLAAAYGLTVSDRRLGLVPLASAPGRGLISRTSMADLARGLFSGPAALFAYLGSGLQLFVSAAMLAWLPSHLHRAYGLDAARSASLGALFFLLSAIGMIACGWAADRSSRGRPVRKVFLAAGFCILSSLLLAAAFALPAGQAQLALLGCGLIVSGGSSGPAGAIVGDVTPMRLHGGAMAVLTLANNLLGLAPGPIVTGLLADHVGLQTALRLIPWVGLVSGAAFLACAAGYQRDADRLALAVVPPPT